MRGNLMLELGSIPASAGEPPSIDPTTARCGVYPRECGGTTQGVWRGYFIQGLSPRVRGNPVGSAPRQYMLGSIPASAGEPIEYIHCFTPYKVYPRECGGTTCSNASIARLTGLSPRVRGNPGVIQTLVL